MPPSSEHAAAASSSSMAQTRTATPSSDEALVVRPLPLPSPQDWRAQLAQSVALVPKLLNILRSRGLPAPTANDDDDENNKAVNFEQVEGLLGCPLPADYKALMQGLPANIQTAWGLDPFYLFRPQEMYSEMKELQKVCHARANYQGVSMRPTDPVSFVPFGNSTSAFYCGWIKTHPHYNTNAPWELVVLDSKNYFEFETGEGMYRPLVEVLYRMVVRAVPEDGECGTNDDV